LNIVVSIQIIALSHFEHTRSVRPSTLLNGYLVFSSVLDLAQLRTLYLLKDALPIAALFSASVGLKLVMLVIESQTKTNNLKPEYRNLPPETTSGIINRSFLWWLNEIFRLGSKGIISKNDLFELDPNLATENVGTDMREAWEKRCTF
jgi:ATP-binding cassette, subfamily C (CFTR/MRP), member 1